ncbi:ATP-dependent RNA helicase dbp7 [Sporothrix curviconia]|uniref:ATP-dependent RNA helicase n=1 Tax=Sporothrix curviconia TaxID=1260050 RepID=A0ABP0C7C0_9PEZI
MADGGMILNIDLDNLAPIPQQVTFKGGKWRDRKQAQRDFKKRQNQQTGGGGSAGDDATTTSERPAKRPRGDDTRTGGGSGGGGGFSDGRPYKTHTGGGGGGGGGPHHSSSASFGGRPMGPGAAPVAAGRPQNGVTSRLFTAIPQHITDFDEAAADAAKDANENGDNDGSSASTRPSNAPLSDEASTFLKLGLSRRIARQLSEFMHLQAPTAIQRNAVTQLVAHDNDAFLQAETGSGKTLAYLLPIVQRLLALSEDNDGVRRSHGTRLSRTLGLYAVVLAPTRELCTQIAVVLDKLLGCAPWLQATTVVGGENKKAEKARLRKGVNILVATPGRLTDHLDNTDVLDVSRVRWLVLDEGDRLMEMGFEKDIKAVVSKIRGGNANVTTNAVINTTKDGQTLPEGILPARRVTVLCSATMQPKAIRLGEMTLEDAVHITSVDEDAPKKGDRKGGEKKEEKKGGKEDSGKEEAEEEEEEEATVFSAPSQLKQTFAIVPPKVRLVALISLLRATFARKDAVMKAIVFLSSSDSVDFHFDLLREFGDDGKPIKTRVGQLPPPGAAETEAEGIDKSAAALIKNAKMAAAAAATTASTVAPAAYITSPANKTVVLHKLHGMLDQPVRKATLAAFRNETRPALLLTTDISARGLDVPTVDLVIEYDPAMAVDDHMHRIGRTARAGRAGSATLFLQPGCEEKYIGFLKQMSSVAHPQLQLYDRILQKGLTAPVPVPAAFTADAGDNIPAEHDPSVPQQSWSKRAEALQLHIEQRLLKSAAAAVVATGANADGSGAPTANKWHDKKKDKKEKERERKEKERRDKLAVTDPTLLDAARQAFKSAIRAYTTHTHSERAYFDKDQLQLGHMAKSFGLREAPAGMKGGGERQAAKKRATAEATAAGRKQHSKPKAKPTTDGASKADRGGAADFSDDDFGGAVEDEEAVKRMQEKMREMMNNPAAEFNIGMSS